MCSSSPARTPKLKLAVEQLLTKGCWNPPPPKNKTKQNKTKTPCPRTNKKPQQDGRRGATTIKSNHTPARWETHKLENNKNK